MAAPVWLTAQPIAHRGCHDAAAGRLENTLAAAEAAMTRGFAIECDLQLTADAEAVVFHDDTLDRLTDLAGPVIRQPLAALRKARLKGSDAHFPTLEELLDLVDGRVPLIIEIKTDRMTDTAPLCLAVRRVLEGYRGPVAVMGFNDDPVVAGRGSAIFLHLARPDYLPTAGCVALAHADLVAALEQFRPGDKIRIG